MTQFHGTARSLVPVACCTVSSIGAGLLPWTQRVQRQELPLSPLILPSSADDPASCAGPEACGVEVLGSFLTFIPASHPVTSTLPGRVAV